METKDLNNITYSNNICLLAALDSKYKGLRIAISNSAMRELMNEGKALEDVLDILENGYRAPRKRKKGTIEKWFDIGKKTYNAVIAKSFDEISKEDVWVLVHFGKFTRKKGVKNEMP